MVLSSVYKLRINSSANVDVITSFVNLNSQRIAPTELTQETKLMALVNASTSCRSKDPSPFEDENLEEQN